MSPIDDRVCESMQYRKLGNTGIRVSVIGMGTWQLGDAEWGRAPDDKTVEAIFDAARQCGVTLIDTAECYGNHTAEERIGRAIGRDRDRWVVATKFGHVYRGPYDRVDDFSASALVRQLDDSLRALRTDRVELLQVHNMTPEIAANDEMWETLLELRRAGKVRAIGAAIKFDPATARPEPLDAVQVIYNRLDRRAEDAVLPACRERGLGVMARVPLARGLLTGKYEIGKRFAEGDPRHGYTPESIDAQLEDVRRIERDELPSGTPLARWALAWCLRNPALSAVIPGCKSAAQLQANAAAAGLDIGQPDHPQAV